MRTPSELGHRQHDRVATSGHGLFLFLCLTTSRPTPATLASPRLAHDTVWAWFVYGRTRDPCTSGDLARVDVIHPRQSRRILASHGIFLRPSPQRMILTSHELIKAASQEAPQGGSTFSCRALTPQAIIHLIRRSMYRVRLHGTKGQGSPSPSLPTTHQSSTKGMKGRRTSLGEASGGVRVCRWESLERRQVSMQADRLLRLNSPA